MLSRLQQALGGGHSFADFVPDGAGMVQRAHSPLAGVLIGTIAVAFAGLLAWSALAEVEQVVGAQGTVEPAGRVKIINHPDGGRIASVHVGEGQTVAAGDPLITFDSELVLTALGELRGQWQLKRAEAARLEAEADGSQPRFPAEVRSDRPDLVRAQLALFAERREAEASRAASLSQAVEQRAREVRSLAIEVGRLRESHALLGEQVDAVRELADKGLYPRLKMVVLERQLADIAGEIRKAQEHLHAAEAALGEAESRRDGLAREWRSAVLGELAAVRAEEERLVPALERQRALLRNLVVRAPVAGVVQDLAVTGPGQSVGSNQPVLKVVPTDGGLVIEARVANQDIGSVRVGQSARVKVRAFDFLRYGTLEGWIERIAADATADPRDGTLGYQVTVRTGPAAFAASEPLAVVPGMVVDVDLLVGARTVLSYLTDRIFRLQDAAFRQG